MIATEHYVQGMGVRVRRRTKVLEQRVVFLQKMALAQEAGTPKSHRIRAELAALEFAVKTIKAHHAEYFVAKEATA